MRFDKILAASLAVLIIMLATGLLAFWLMGRPAGFDQIGIQTSAEPITVTKLAGYPDLGSGLFRYVDRDTGVVVYLSAWGGQVNITSQKVAVK